LTVPLPVPEPPDVIVIQAGTLVVFQGLQPLDCEAVTTMDPVLALAGWLALAGDIV
jgi:hypothetical protein